MIEALQKKVQESVQDMAGATALAFVLYTSISAVAATASIALWHTMAAQHGEIFAWWAVVAFLFALMLVALQYHRKSARLQNQKDRHDLDRTVGSDNAVLGIVQGASQASEIARQTIRAHPTSSIALAAAVGFALARKSNDLGSLIRLALRLL